MFPSNPPPPQLARGPELVCAEREEEEELVESRSQPLTSAINSLTQLYILMNLQSLCISVGSKSNHSKQEFVENGGERREKRPY